MRFDRSGPASDTPFQGNSSIQGFRSLQEFIRAMQSISACGKAFCVFREGWILLLWLYLLLGQNAWGCQPPERPLIPDKVPAILEDGSIKPDAFYLRDSNGNPIYVPRQRYEEFERHQREVMSLENIEVPDFAFELMQGSIAIESEVAKVKWKATLRPLDKDSKVIRCRIGLKDQNIYGPMTAVGGQVNFMRPLAEGGYEWWILPDASSSYSIEFQTTTRVTSSGAGNSLRFDLPNAPTEIQLAIPNREQDVTVAGVGVPTIEWDEANPTLAYIRSTGGMQVISWRSKSDNNTLDAIEVESLTRLSLNQLSQAWTGTTRFEFRPSSRKATREIEILLPPGMHWLPSSATPLDANFLISNLPLDTTRSDAGERLQLKILDTSSEKNEVSIAWDWTAPVDSSGRFVFRGPRLSGVQRHTGKLEIDTGEDQRLRWEHSPLLQFSQQERLSDTARSLRSSFRFANQEFELTGNATPAVTTTRLRPWYLARVETDQVLLTGFIEFASELSQLADVRLRIGDWQIQSIELDGRSINADDFMSPLGLPLSEWVLQTKALGNGSASGGVQTHSLKIAAVMPWSCEDVNSLQMQLPDVSFVASNGVDRVTDHGAGYFLLTYPSNLQVAEASIQATGIMGDIRSNPALEELVGNQSLANSLSYRFNSEPGALTWAGKWQRLHRRVLLRQQALITAEKSGLSLQQSFDGETLHEPLQRLRIAVPRTLLTGIALGQDQLDFRLDGKSVDWISLQDEARWQGVPQTHPNTDWEVVELLTKNFNDRFRLEIFSQQSHTWPTELKSLSREVELPLPLWDAPVVYLDQKTTLKTAIDLDAEVPSDLLPSEPAPFSRSRDLILSPNVPSIPLELNRVTALPPPSVQIRRAYLHTAINSKDIRHRAVFQLTTSASDLLLRLPDAANSNTNEVQGEGPSPEFLLNGTRVAGVLKEGLYSIPLSSNGEGTTYSCEVWFWQKRQPAWSEHIIGWVPEIIDSSLGAPMLWQVTLPQGDILISSDSGLAPEFEWAWTWFGVQRRASWQQSQIESWVAGSHQPEIGSQANHVVLSLSSIASPSIWLMPRIWIVVATLMLLGLASWVWISIARSRVGVFLLVLGSALIVLMFSVELAIVVIQTSLFAMFVILVTQSLTWLFVRPSSRSIYGRSVPMTWGPSNSKVSVASTQAADLVLQPTMEATE